MGWEVGLRRAAGLGDLWVPWERRGLEEDELPDGL